MWTDEIVLVAGTRPEGIKLAPLARALAGRRVPYRIVDSGQQPGRVEEALHPFDLAPHRVLRPDRRTGTLAELSAALIGGIDAELTDHPAAAVVVQGATTSALVGAQVAFWHRIPVVHLEAGLRSHDLDQPFPEEANRAMLARIAVLHLAPTRTAVRQLRAEGLTNIALTGNTVVDAVRHLTDSGRVVPPDWYDPHRRLILATTHRRENWGAGIDGVCAALRRLAFAADDLQVVVVTHPNPALAEQVRAVLGSAPVKLTPPLPYSRMLGLIGAADLVITDSGGLQEEATTLGVPVLVTRETTERPEVLTSGLGRLVGTDPDAIATAAVRLLNRGRRRRPRGCPFGDGHAGERAADAIDRLLGLSVRPRTDTHAAARPRLGELFRGRGGADQIRQ